MPKWKTKLPFWNTGRVYATTASKWDAAAYGMVCTGSRDVLIGEHFARLVCHDNGFDQLDFYGHQVDYVAFIDGQREALGDQVDYLASVYNQTEQFDAPFIVSGAKCDDDNDDLNTCTILDYRKLGKCNHQQHLSIKFTQAATVWPTLAPCSSIAVDTVTQVKWP